MGSCQENTAKYIRSETFKLAGIKGVTRSTSDYIIIHQDGLSVKPLLIKLQNADLSDFLFRLSVFMDR